MENQCSQTMLYRKNLEGKLASMRYEYSLSVSYTCINLAMHYGCDLDRAELAGLLHDCRKRYSDDIILRRCLKHGLEVTDAEYKALPMLHAKYRAWPAEHRYQITDREVLDVIGCHATDRPKMITLDKILYITDCIKPRRYKAESLPEIRRLAYEDLGETTYTTLAGTLDHLKKKRGKYWPLDGSGI